MSYLNYKTIYIINRIELVYKIQFYLFYIMEKKSSPRKKKKTLFLDNGQPFISVIELSV